MEEEKHLTARQALRKYCHDCVCSRHNKDVEACEVTKCPLYVCRNKRPIPNNSPLKAIRKNCLYCCNDQIEAVRYCLSEDCVLYPYRMGKNPYRKKRILTEEEKQKLTERLLRARERLSDGEENTK